MLFVIVVFIDIRKRDWFFSKLLLMREERVPLLPSEKYNMEQVELICDLKDPQSGKRAIDIPEEILPKSRISKF